MHTLKEWSLSRLLLLVASVFAVAGVTALVLLLAQNIPGIPLFSDVFKPVPQNIPTALSDEDKLAILATLSNNTSTTTQSEKEAVLSSLYSHSTGKSDMSTVEQKLRILSTLSSANTQQ